MEPVITLFVIGGIVLLILFTQLETMDYGLFYSQLPKGEEVQAVGERNQKSG